MRGGSYRGISTALSLSTQPTLVMKRKSPKYLNFIRSLPCVICNDPTTTDAAHVRCIASCGVGLKPPDEGFTLPLCGAHHREQHSRGERLWWDSKNLDPKEITTELKKIFDKFDNNAGQRWANAVYYVEGINEFQS